MLRVRRPVEDVSLSGDTWPLAGFLIPLAALAVYISGADVQSVLGDRILEALSVAVALAGFVLRVAVFGAYHEAKVPPVIRVRGLYRAVPYPIIVSDMLILAGFVLGTEVWWFAVVAFGAAGFACYRALGAADQAAADSIEALARDACYAGFIPIHVFDEAAPKFSLRRGIHGAYPSLFLITTVTVAMEIVHDVRVGKATFTSWPSDWWFYFAAFGLGLVGFLMRQADLRRAPALKAFAADGGPRTRGLRVDGRAGLVDALENLISGGQQERILLATLAAAEMKRGETLVDIGCGTGKLVIAATTLVGPKGLAIGIDATPGMIKLARERAKEVGSAAEFQEGVAEALPFEDGSADAVTSSYFFHHLPSDLKRLALREMWRVLAPGGRLVITDYGTPRGLKGYIASLPMRVDFHEYVRPQLRGELEAIVREEGLEPVERVTSFLGYINVLRLRKPAT